MTVIDRLSNSLGDRDHAADIALAEDIVRTKNVVAIRELVDHLPDKNRHLQSDCMKTLYEIGERVPELIAPYVDEFAAQLTSKNPRMIWGAMCALDGCASAEPDAVFPYLAKIVEAAEGESVVSRDHCVNILAKLSLAGHAQKCFPILLDIIRTAPINQLPSYCEKAAEAVMEKERATLACLIRIRLEDVEQRPKRVRMEKVLKKL